ncbi:MAG: GTPase [Dictyoglomus turgidum]|nr:MAG: GTPase [Dictyoglomus turgidum]
MKKVIIMGAGGRDFHNFNVIFKDNPQYKVVAFTATQIPGIENRIYPKDLAGDLYPDGIPIFPEEELPELIKRYEVDEVVFSYSDVSYNYVMQRASLVLSLGVDFRLLGTETMLKSKKPVVAICAVRTGSGKSQTTRYVVRVLRDMGLKTVVVRHPMPYGDFLRQKVQRFEKMEDLDTHECTIEEREEYEPHIRQKAIVYAGVDYKEILKEAESEADVIVWDGGNNDFPFYRPDLYITVVDPYRSGHELSYYPGEINLILANVVVVNKVDTAPKNKVQEVVENVRKRNKKCQIIYAKSPIRAEKEEDIKGKKVLVVEDGPTVTHGEMPFGAGYIFAREKGAIIVNPRDYAVGSIKEAYEKYTHLREVLPALGYSREQLKELEETINKFDGEYVIIGTPIDLRRVINIKKKTIRIFYEYEDYGEKTLKDLIKEWWNNLS